jgi:hypothetical protein
MLRYTIRKFRALPERSSRRIGTPKPGVRRVGVCRLAGLQCRQMRRRAHCLELIDAYLRVDLGRAQVGMFEQSLDVVDGSNKVGPRERLGSGRGRPGPLLL